jgi:hypothetical protein
MIQKRHLLLDILLAINYTTQRRAKMAMTPKERDEAYRNRMYDAGYKQMRIWVPRESEGKAAKMERRMFTARLDELTAGWSKARLSKFFSEALKIIKEKIKEGGQKE